MHVTVYADILFLTNFLSNLFLLVLTRKLTKNRTHFLMQIAGAVLGSVYALLLFFPALTFLQGTFFRILTALTVLCVSFRFCTFKQFMQCTIVFAAVSLLSGGCCYALFFMTNLGFQTGAVLSNGIFYWHVPVYVILLAFVAAYGLLFAFEKLISFYTARAQNLHTLGIDYRGKHIECRALLDTGNALYDAVYALPVVIVQTQTVLPFLEEKPNTLHKIPYRTLTGEENFLPAFKPDSIEVDHAPAATCMLALTDARLCFDGQYQALLHPNVIRGGSYEHQAKITADK